MTKEKKEEESNIYPIIGIIIGVVIILIIVAFAFSPPQNNQTPTDISTQTPQIETEMPQTENQTSPTTPSQTPPIVNQTTPQVPTQFLQSQCDTKAKPIFDGWVAYMQPYALNQFGSIPNYTYFVHYNKSMNACIMSIHAEGFSSKLNLSYDYYWLFNIDKKTNQEIGSLWYSGQTIAHCVADSLPCNSIEEYTLLISPYLDRLTNPYLNN